MNLGPSLRRAGSAATVVAAGLAAAVHVTGPAAAAPSFRTERVSVSSAGAQGDDWTSIGDLSADGRYVVFESYSSTLVPGDTNGTGDVFLRDRQTNVTTRLSVSASGGQADGASSGPRISADGRYVTFVSFAANLVPDPRPEIGYDVYLLDRQTGSLERVSDTPDGRPADGDSYETMISADGRYVVFETYAGNLIPGVTGHHVVRYDRTTAQFSVVDVAADGTTPAGGSAQSISANGRYVVFVSDSADLAPGDTNGVGDIYVRDLVTGTNVRVSVGDDEHQQAADDSRGAEVSDDGRYVSFWSYDNTLVDGDDNNSADVFVRDLVAGTTRLVSAAADGTPGNDYSGGTSITPDGRYVVFHSAASDLVAGDTNGADDVFRKDLRTGTTTLVSRRTGGAQGNGAGYNGTVTPNGKIIAYGSSATNLVAGDTNGQPDLFVTRIG